MKFLVLFTFLGLCIASPLGDIDKEYVKEGMDLKELKADLKELSQEVEEEFSGKEDELEDLRANYQMFNSGNQNYTTVSSINELNSNTAGELFEGDIVLTPEQWKVARDLDPSKPLTRRQALTVATKLWQPMGAPIIYYAFAPSFPAQGRQIAMEAMRFWESRTCIRFSPATPSTRDYIYLKNDNDGCWSYIGKVGGRQFINLQTNGCQILTIIAHEISHSFGTYHVQSRSDRDRYVQIDTTNIQANMEHNFARDPEQGLSTYGIPYEFGSMQHYDQFAFAKDYRRPTIYVKQPYTNYQNSLEAPRATFYDTLLINKIYKCTDKCRTPPTCYNNGVADGRDCTKCFCPKGWAGPNCQSRPAGAQIVQVTQNGQKLRVSLEGPSSGWQEKLYILQAPQGRRIGFNINTFGSLLYNRCISAGMEVIFSKDTRAAGYKFCNTPRVNNFMSEGNTMLVWLYRSDANALYSDITLSLA